MIHLDLETRSVADLPKVGAKVYAEDDTSEVMCLVARTDKGRFTWHFRECPTKLERLYDLFIRGDQIAAWNAPFEYHVWNSVMVRLFDAPPLKIEQMRCTMARAYAMSLPGALEKCAIALEMKQQKDMEGNKLMRRLCKPKEITESGVAIFHDPTTAELERLVEYCDVDTIVEKAICGTLPALTDKEQEVWELDLRINSRGVPVDLETIAHATKLCNAAKVQHNNNIKRLTNGALYSANQSVEIVKWLATHGVEVTGIAKDIVEHVLEEDVPDIVRAVLNERLLAAKTSTAKLNSIMKSQKNARIYGMFQYHAAGPGRWGGRRVQLQNIPRPSKDFTQEDIEIVVRSIAEGRPLEQIEILYGPLLGVMAMCLRAILATPEGEVFLSADLSNIEGRALPWLAGEQWKLDAFSEYDRGEGPDIYLLSYSRAFYTTIEGAKPYRQIGKVTELSMGFGGGVGAFQNMAKNYGVKVTDTRANEIKKAWREAHPAIVAYWTGLEIAAKRAIRKPGVKYYAETDYTKGDAKISYVFKDKFLMCTLPSGRTISYYDPKLQVKKMSWGEERLTITYMSEDSQRNNKWCRVKTYGGKLAENVTQAVARDILAENMLLIDPIYPIVLHVHDEAVSIVAESQADVSHYETLMSALPSWAAGLPIAAEGWAGKRYRK